MAKPGGGWDGGKNLHLNELTLEGTWSFFGGILGGFWVLVGSHGVMGG